MLSDDHNAPQSTMEAASVLWNISRAFLARLLFVIHSVATVWQTSLVTEAEWLWGFALLILLVVFEGSHTIIMRAGDERKWFCTSVLLYVLATAPPIWMLERHLCDLRVEYSAEKDGKALPIPFITLDDDDQTNEVLRVQIVEQVMLVVLILGRWLLPKGEISSEQLSQILLAYLAIASDIVEFFDVFKEPMVYKSRTIQHVVLFAWTLSLLQFPFVITTSRARKMRVAITKVDDYATRSVERKRSGIWKMTYDVDLWAIVLANVLQDIPFLLVRLYLMLFYRLSNYTLIFFTCKNALIILLQTYRAIILINDRYVEKKPKPPPPAKELPPPPRKRRRTRGNVNRGEDDEEMMLTEPLTPKNPKKHDKHGHHTTKRGKSISIERDRSPATRSGSMDARDLIGSGASNQGDHNRNEREKRVKMKGKRREERDRDREREHRYRERDYRERV
uniref:Transmembrane protein 26 n=1 Tax=Pristionchus pacificus TaxID=54126 RepID=A0A8R1YYF3_PRIPA